MSWRLPLVLLIVGDLIHHSWNEDVVEHEEEQRGQGVSKEYVEYIVSIFFIDILNIIGQGLQHLQNHVNYLKSYCDRGYENDDSYHKKQIKYYDLEVAHHAFLVHVIPVNIWRTRSNWYIPILWKMLKIDNIPW